jgi:hypothetical protein
MPEQLSETLNPSNAALLLIGHQVGTMNFGISDLSAMELKNHRPEAVGSPGRRTPHNHGGHHEHGNGRHDEDKRDGA